MKKKYIVYITEENVIRAYDFDKENCVMLSFEDG